MCLAAALGQADSAGAAAQALKDICQSCSGQLAGYMEALMQLYRQVQRAGALGTKNDAMALDEEDVEQVLLLIIVITPGLDFWIRTASYDLLQPG